MVTAPAGPYAPYDRLLEQFVLLQRYLLVLPATNATALAGLVTSFGTVVSVPFKVSPNQAIRVVKNSWGRCRRGVASPDLTCESLSMVIQTGNGDPVLIWSGFYSGDKLGDTGAFVTTDGDDVLFGRDVLSLPTPQQPFAFNCQADVFNSGLANETFRLDGTLLIELWEISPTSRMRG